MKRVSLSNLKTMGRHHSQPPQQDRPIDDVVVAQDKLITSHKTTLCRGNNIFTQLRYKWNKKLGNKNNPTATSGGGGAASTATTCHSLSGGAETTNYVVTVGTCTTSESGVALLENNNDLSASNSFNDRATITVNFHPGSLTRELFKLSRCGWYWGPITRSEAEEKLTDQPDGAFLVRDSSDDRYILSLSFRSCSNTLHTRIEHSNGLFSFYAVQHQPSFIVSHPQDAEGRISIVALIEESMCYSQSGVFCYSRGRTPDSPSYPVRLTKPVSRFNQVRTLQYLCRFVIRQITRLDHIQKLPLPNPIKGYLEESHY